MGDEERSALSRLYEALRFEVSDLKEDVRIMNKHMMWGFALILTGFVLPVGVAIIMATMKMVGG